MDRAKKEAFGEVAMAALKMNESLLGQSTAASSTAGSYAGKAQGKSGWGQVAKGSQYLDVFVADPEEKVEIFSARAMPAGGQAYVGKAMVTAYAIDTAASTNIKDAAEPGMATRVLPPSEFWSLGTASGPVYANQASVVIPSKQIGAIEASDLPDSQNALSLRRLCMEKGFGCTWPPYGYPNLTIPVGSEVPLGLEEDVPHPESPGRRRGTSCGKGSFVCGLGKSGCIGHALDLGKS